MVVGTTVSEQVTLDILSSLREIDGAPDHTHDLSQSVYRMGGNVLSLPSYPACIVIDGGTEEDDSNVNGLIQVVHSYDIVVAASASDNDWSIEVRELLAEVTAKLREDWTRGGPAHTTRVDTSDAWDADSEGTGVVGGAVSVTVVYRHAYGDPTTPY